MVDSCRQLTVSQSNGDEDTAGMVTILTGHQVEELCTQSAAMKVSSLTLFCYITDKNKHSGSWHFPPRQVKLNGFQFLLYFGYSAVFTGLCLSLLCIYTNTHFTFIVLQEIFVFLEINLCVLTYLFNKVNVRSILHLHTTSSQLSNMYVDVRQNYTDWPNADVINKGNMFKLKTFTNCLIWMKHFCTFVIIGPAIARIIWWETCLFFSYLLTKHWWQKLGLDQQIGWADVRHFQTSFFSMC